MESSSSPDRAAPTEGRCNPLKSCPHAFTSPPDLAWRIYFEATYKGDIAQLNCLAASPVLEPIAWYVKNSSESTHPVAQKEPNPWGLYDILGNVQEWTWDWHSTGDTGAVQDPTGPLSGSTRARRGGGWHNEPRYCRLADRFGSTPEYRSGLLGFRPARSL